MPKLTRDDIDKFYDYDIDLPHRILYMGSVAVTEDLEDESGTDSQMAERIIKGLTILDQKEGDITIIMNNVGGDHYHGMAIFDAIQACQNHVTIKVFGHAFSMGSIILQAADKRVLAPNSRVMIHYGSDGANMNGKDFQAKAKEGERLDVLVEDIYLDKIREKNEDYSREDLEKLLLVDTYLSPQEAVDLGLADEILS